MRSKSSFLCLILITGILLSSQHTLHAQISSTAAYNTADHDKEIIAYFTQWDAWKAANAGLSAQGIFNQLNIDYTQYTMLNWSFFGVAQDGSLHSGDYRNQQIYQVGEVQAPAPLFMEDTYSSWDYWLFYGELEILHFLPDNLDELPTHATYWAYADHGYTGNGTGWINTNTGATGAYPLSLPKPGGAPGLKALCQQNGVKMVASIGGWSMCKHFPEMAADPVKRQVFVDDCVELINMGFDGIDLDWEYPNSPGMNIENYGPDDYENFAILVEEIRAAIGADKDITAAFSASPANLAGFDWARLSNTMTYFNMMSYDYEGGWSDVTGHNSSLYESSGLCWDNTLQYMLTAGVSPGKINMGTAFYGRGVNTNGAASLGATTLKTATTVQPDGPINTASDFTNWTAFDGTPFYYYLKNEIENPANGWTISWDDVGKVPYATKGNYFLSYDNEQSIALKADYVNDNNLAGVIIWTVFGDWDIGPITTTYANKLPYCPATTAPLANKLNEVFANGSSNPPSACGDKKYLVGYWHNWDNAGAPYIPLDEVDCRYNVVNLSFAIPSPGNDYDMTFPLCCGETQAGLISKINTLQNNGVIVNISIGGATDPVHLTSEAEKNTFISTMNNIINTYGFDGLDIDLEGASISITGGSTIANPTDAGIVYFIEAIQQIITDYQATNGEKIFLSAAPETAFVQGGQSAWGGIWGAYLPLLDAIRDDMDLLHVQLYNSGSMFGLDGAIYTQGTADFIVSQVEAVIAGFNTGGGFFNGFPECKVAVGLPACPSAAGGGFTNTATVKSAIDYIMGNGSQPGNYTLQAGPYPDFAGMMTWSVNWDAVSSCNASAYEYAENFESIFPVETCGEVATCSQPNLGPDISACGLTFPYQLDSNTPIGTGITFTWTNLTTNQVLVSNSATANTYNISAAGSYEVSRDSLGCVEVDVINVLDDFVNPVIPANIDLCNTVPESIAVGNLVSFPAGTSWAWYKDNVLLENETSGTYTDVRMAGTYKVVATYQTCSAEAITIVSSDLPEPVDGCGEAGTAITLSINTTDAGPFDWYDAATGGSPLGTGTSYTTPPLNNTTTYYVESAGGGGVSNATTGPTLMGNGLGNLNNWTSTSEISFDVENDIVLKGFTVYPMIWNCSAHSITLEIRDASGTVLPNGNQTFNIVGTNCNGVSGAVAITLSGAGVAVAPGTGYKIVSTGTVGINHWAGPAPYPMNYSPYFTITGGNNANTYMAIHDWVIEGSGGACARLPVIANIDSNCDGTACENYMEINDNPIITDLYHAADAIHSAGKVMSGAVVNFKAGNTIKLDSGFEANPGCEFSAEIEGCLD